MRRLRPAWFLGLFLLSSAMITGGIGCKNNGSTPNTQYHSECRNNSCVPISGAGTDQCSTNADCTVIAQITAAVALIPTSGTPNAVELDSLLYENITTSLGTTVGYVDPASIRISISPSLSFSGTAGFAGGMFDGYVFITPDGFMSAGTTYSVTTSFNTVINNNSYALTRYNTFTTVAGAGTNSVSPGSSFILTVTNVTQPPGLGSLLAGNIPAMAINTITKTTSVSNANAGSIIFYGGEAVSTASPTDISPYSFTLPLAGQWNGSYVMSSGSAMLSVAGIIIPLQTFALSGTFNATGGIGNGVLYAVVHCTDMSCSNLGTTVGPIIAQYIDTNGNMAILGTFIGSRNTVPYTAWIGGSDTVNTTLVNGIGPGISTAVLEVTTTTSPLLSTATLPYVILTTTDSNNMLNIAADGQGSPALPQASPINLTYALTTQSGAPFATTAGTPYTGYYLFGLSTALITQFTP